MNDRLNFQETSHSLDGLSSFRQKSDMAPPKPWERSAVPQRNPQQVSIAAGDIGLRENSFMGANDLGSGTSTNNPPPIPPRPVNGGTLGTNNHYDYGTSYGVSNPYYYGGTSTSYPSYYGGYGGYGGYNRLPYSTPYYGPNGNGDLVRIAEEQSRTAFQSVESIVQAFSSVSMMMESTLNAIYSSFRAVLGVADQFSRLKFQLSQIVASLAVVRFLRYLWRRILIFLRLRPAAGNADELWRQIMTTGAAAPTAAQILAAHGAGKTSSSWPTLVFFTFVVGGPFLIWKLVSKLVTTIEDQKRWATGEKSHFMAVALYDFDAGSNGELTIRAGQRLRLAPKELQPSVRGWILGSVDGTSVGLIPANYIKIIGKQNVDEEAGQSSPTTSQGLSEKPLNADLASSSDLEKLFEASGNKSI